MNGDETRVLPFEAIEFQPQPLRPIINPLLKVASVQNLARPVRWPPQVLLDLRIRHSDL
jgi:hypothetical protein